MSNEIEILRKEANMSTDKDFEAKYPGFKRKAVQDMTDEELEKVIGGLITGIKPPYSTSGGTGGTSTTY